jgi:hypothetical protein
MILRQPCDCLAKQARQIWCLALFLIEPIVFCFLLLYSIFNSFRLIRLQISNLDVFEEHHQAKIFGVLHFSQVQNPTDIDPRAEYAKLVGFSVLFLFIFNSLLFRLLDVSVFGVSDE